MPIRLHLLHPYAAGQEIRLEEGQSHYLAHVMRCKEGDEVAVFNGQDGEWRAEIASVGKKAVTVRLMACLRAQKDSPDLWLAFAPVKQRLDLIVEKAVELGVSALLPVFTRHCVVRSINRDKMAAHAAEAAEQSGRHDVPRIEEYKDLTALLGAWPKDRTLLFADEHGQGENLKTLLPALPPGKYGVLIGPEGGFAPEERRVLSLSPSVRAFCLGPRILRADTAAIAALACVQAWIGDWEEKPDFGLLDDRMIKERGVS